jgi:hypothetical protein
MVEPEEVESSQKHCRCFMLPLHHDPILKLVDYSGSLLVRFLYQNFPFAHIKFIKEQIMKTKKPDSFRFGLFLFYLNDLLQDRKSPKVCGSYTASYRYGYFYCCNFHIRTYSFFYYKFLL